eukprot:2594515-Prymnesium_polylepis.1
MAPFAARRAFSRGAVRCVSLAARGITWHHTPCVASERGRSEGVACAGGVRASGPAARWVCVLASAVGRSSKVGVLGVPVLECWACRVGVLGVPCWSVGRAVLECWPCPCVVPLTRSGQVSLRVARGRRDATRRNPAGVRRALACTRHATRRTNRAPAAAAVATAAPLAPCPRPHSPPRRLQA